MVQQLKVTETKGTQVHLSAEPVRSFLGEKQRSFWLDNSDGVAVEEGRWVEVYYSSGRGLLDVFLLLMLPIILVVAIAYSLPAAMPQAQQVVWSLLGVPVGIGCFIVSQKLLPRMRPQISKVLSKEEETGHSMGCGSGCVCK